VGHATHYHTLWVNPYWAGSLEPVGTIGAHKFYRNRGAGGRKSAFTTTYAGSEPTVRGRTVTAPVRVETTAGPAQVVTATGEPSVSRSRNMSATSRPVAAPVQAAPTGSPVADPSLREAGQVKEPYANAGKWKTDPSTLDLNVSPPGPDAN
ncbi:MAG: cell wall hydrolase, partial [Pseudomonadota bacterium]